MVKHLHALEKDAVQYQPGSGDASGLSRASDERATA